MSHHPHRKDCDVAGVIADQFDGVNCALPALGIDIDQHDFCANILNLPQHRVGWAGGKTDVAKDIAPNLRALQPLLEYRQPFFVFR